MLELLWFGGFHNNPRASGDKKKKKHFPEISFLSETKNSGSSVINSLDWMDFENNTSADPYSAGGGGLALFWKKETHLTVVETHQNFIYAKL